MDTSEYQREGVFGSPPASGAGNLASSNLAALTKHCRRCDKTKSVREFHRRGKSYQSWCKECKKLLDAAWWQANKERLTPSKNRRKQEIREWFLSLKGQYKCARCPEDHPVALHFHHVDPSKKDFALAFAVARGYRKERIEAEMAKCEVLCANCHAKLHWEDGSLQLEVG